MEVGDGGTEESLFSLSCSGLGIKKEGGSFCVLLLSPMGKAL